MQKLGKNLGAYFGEVIDVAAVLRNADVTASERGWGREVFHRNNQFEWTAFHRASRGGQTLTRVYISAGIHGDEPAGPLAALRLLRENNWPDNVEIWLAPCINPTGFLANRRENEQGIDLNRDYLHLQSAEIRAHVAWLERQPQFDFCLCLHEDWESHGFYVYELNPDRLPSLAEAILQEVAKVCPIDPSEIIEGRPAKAGLIQPIADPKSRPQWPEAFWLLTHKARLTYTLEAPSDFSLQTRVDALVAGVNAALARHLLK